MTANIYSFKQAATPPREGGKAIVARENNDNVKKRITDKDQWALLVADIAERRDRDAFKCLYNYFAPRVKSFMLRSGLKEGAAEEIAQETLLTVWRKSEQFNSQLAGVSTWIFTIARNKKIDKFRKDSKPLPDVNDPSFGSPEEMSPEQHMSQSLHAEKLNKALELLPADQRAVLVASFIQDNAHKDIAKELGIPLGTVKSRIRLGLTRLRSLMGEFEGGL